MRIFEVSRTEYVPKIRIINLVDILLVLLLFLFATTTFRSEAPSAVNVSLPEAQTADASDSIHQFRFEVEGDMSEEDFLVFAIRKGFGLISLTLRIMMYENPKKIKRLIQKSKIESPITVDS